MNVHLKRTGNTFFLTIKGVTFELSKSEIEMIRDVLWSDDE
jgi:hypothetical protein